MNKEQEGPNIAHLTCFGDRKINQESRELNEIWYDFILKNYPPAYELFNVLIFYVCVYSVRYLPQLPTRYPHQDILTICPLEILPEPQA